MKIKFFYLFILLVLSSQKCIFHEYSNSKKISIINLKTNKSIEDYHPLNIFVDYSNIINQKEKSKLINELNYVSDILNQLISIKNIQWIKYTNDSICNMKIKLNETISEGINADLIIIPLIDNSINQVLGRMCLIDDESKRSIINLLYLPQDFKYNKNQILHQLFHILGFNTNNIKINQNSYAKTFSTYKKLFSALNEFNNKISDWDNKVIIKDIMSNETKFEDISELTLSLLKDKNNNYKFNKCFIYKPINENLIYYGIDLNNKLICYLNSKENIIKKQCGINKFPLKSDILETSKNYNFKIYQSIYLLTPSEKCPNKHPRTVWFYNIKKYSNRTIPKKFKIEKFDITNKDYVIKIGTKRHVTCFFSTYKLIMNFNNILAFRDLSNVNVYDELNKYNKKLIVEKIKNFNKYIQYNNFHFIQYLSKKDDLYRCYKRMKKKFPDDYNFMQETFILPDDKEIIKEKFKDYKLSKDNLWLIKPPNRLQGKGVKILTNFSNLYHKGIITHYVPNPLLLHGRKFDLRVYIFISSFLPLKIYFNNEGLVRVSVNYYNLDEENYSNSFIHLTNTVLNIKNKNFTHGNNMTDERGNIWSFKAFKNYLIKRGYNYDKLFERMKDIIIKSILSTEYIFTKESRENYFGKRVSTAIGLDILVDENLTPWLLEMNCNCPDFGLHDIIDETIKSDFMTNYLNIIGLVPFSHKNGKPLDDVYQYNNTIEEVVDDSLCEFERVDGDLERIFPKKDNIERYKKYFENPGKENELLWEKLQTFE